jgi:hypothetical protein
MRISHGQTTNAIDTIRQMIDNMNGLIVRITTREDSPYRPSETFDVQLRQADWATRDPDRLFVREYDRAQGIRIGGNEPVHVERIHIY